MIKSNKKSVTEYYRELEQVRLRKLVVRHLAEVLDEMLQRFIWKLHTGQVRL